jgi:hypothetical protein
MVCWLLPLKYLHPFSWETEIEKERQRQRVTYKERDKYNTFLFCTIQILMLLIYNVSQHIIIFQATIVYFNCFFTFGLVPPALKGLPLLFFYSIKHQVTLHLEILFQIFTLFSKNWHLSSSCLLTLIQKKCYLLFLFTLIT